MHELDALSPEAMFTRANAHPVALHEMTFGFFKTKPKKTGDTHDDNETIPDVAA